MITRAQELDEREILVNECNKAHWEKTRLAELEFTFRENVSTLRTQELDGRERLVEEKRKETIKAQHALTGEETQLKLYHALSKLYQDIISIYRSKHTPEPGASGLPEAINLLMAGHTQLAQLNESAEAREDDHRRRCGVLEG